MSMYGPPGSGKTLSALLFAEGLALREGKRVAVIDTENGTDFYALPSPARECHPGGFDFDALYTRSLSEAIKAVRSLDHATHGAIVVDSITHLWEAAVAAYKGRTHGGKIPFHAWGTIKKPYKELMAFLINSPFHVFILGRQGNEFAEDDETGETKAVGVKMKAEGETQYEPHVAVRMEAVRPAKKGGLAVVTLFGEKDRTSTVQGRAVAWPTFDSVIKPMLALLGHGTGQAQVQGEDEAAAVDAEAFAAQERQKAQWSAKTRREFEDRFRKAETPQDVQAVGIEIKPVKARLLPGDAEALAAAYCAARDRAAGNHRAAAQGVAAAAQRERYGSNGSSGGVLIEDDDPERAAIQAEGKDTAAANR